MSRIRNFLALLGLAADVDQLSGESPGSWVRLVVPAARAIVVLAVTALLSVISKLDPAHVFLIACLGLGGFGVLAALIRRIWVGSAPQPAAPPGLPAGLIVLGRTNDGRAVISAGGRIVEFDALAYQYYEGRDERQRGDIARAVLAAPRKSRFNASELALVVRGGPTDWSMDEEVFPVWIDRDGRIRFRTKSELRAMSASERADAFGLNDRLRAWYKGMGVPEAVALVQNILDDTAPRQPRPPEIGIALGPLERALVYGPSGGPEPLWRGAAQALVDRWYAP